MSNERKLRLIQVAKEFKVGLNTITDFLQKKGIKTDGSPNTLVEPDVYAVLEKEFGGSRITGNERESIRERISQKQATITLEEAQKQTREEEQEVIIKSNVISVKDELPQPKILGKIDLSPKPKPAPKPVSKPAAEPVPEAAAPKPQPAPQPAAPKTEAAPASETASAAKPEPEAAPKSDNIFRPAVQTLTGPQVLGTMDVSGFTPGNRHKRKRLSKEKVDVPRTPAGGPKPGSNGKSAAQPSRGQGPQSNQPRPGENKKTRKDKLKAPKPVVRPEISDEEVSKQVKDTLARLTSKNAKSKGSKYRKEKREAVAERMNEEFQREEQERSILKVTEFVTVAELATMMNVSATEVITACMNLGLMVSINQRLDAEALVVVAEEFGFKTEFVSADIQEAIGDDEQDSEEDLVPRPPIVTVMGHVDHGKTSLLDNIRKTNVIEGEAGGITQHIGAYSVELNGQKITFLDTPGHEAFTAMRARGAKITDVAIIIVAADDNVMPQTVEAINHAQAAGVPMVFAINKIDKPAANPDHIKEQLSQMNYLVESWGGKYQDQEVSAKKGLNLDKLLEKVLLEAEMLDLKANPNRRASGAVIESTLDKGRGYVATVLVQNGTLHIGDVMLSGIHTGRVKAMFNENGQKVTEAGPSTPVQVLGLNGAPQAGDTFNVMEDDRSAREIANKREQLQRIQGIMTQKHVTLDEIGRRIAIGSFKELNIIVKGDVDGSVEAMSGSLIKLSKETVQVNVIHSAVGQISESDVLLAAASNAIIVGFQVRPSASARKLAEKEEIEIRLYSIIYDAINDIKDAIEGMLEPVMKEEIVCSAEVMEIFRISKVGTVAGCVVREGKLTRHTPIRVIRDGIVIYTGKLGSLKRFKDDVKEVLTGQDCGLNIESFNDIRVGDVIEGYEQVEVKRN
ncbi:translation initiation factor IF-2 [Alistipes putredinis]|uniref:translation initiation factor IF-2 n=6 Tax=Alistipes putredinis TaxID=28117 RepID=UPI002673CD4F|nr:translation initiation factor IF-2 [Alistipes putredinis]